MSIPVIIILNALLCSQMLYIFLCQARERLHYWALLKCLASILYFKAAGGPLSGITCCVRNTAIQDIKDRIWNSYISMKLVPIFENLCKFRKWSKLTFWIPTDSMGWIHTKSIWSPNLHRSWPTLIKAGSIWGCLPVIWKTGCLRLKRNIHIILL